MAHHPLRLHLANDIDHLVLRVAIQPQRVVAKVKETNVTHPPQRLRRGLGFVAAGVLDLLQRHAVLFPQLGAFAALAEAQAGDGHLIAHLLMQSDGTARAPDEIGGMGGDHKGSFSVGHGLASSTR